MSTNLLREEYKMLAVLISKGIMGMLGSHDSLSTPKIVTIDWIRKKKPVNWLSFIWASLKEVVGNFEVVENDKGQWELSHMVTYALQIYKYLVAKGLVGEEEGIPLESGKLLGGFRPNTEGETLRLQEPKSTELSFQFQPQHRGGREGL